MKRAIRSALITIVLASTTQLAVTTAVGVNAAAAATPGSGWQAVPAASPNAAGGGLSLAVNDRLNSVSCADGACMSVGDELTTVNGFTTEEAVAEHETGASWSLTPPTQPSGEFGDQLSGVSCAAASNCVAVGNQGGGGVSAGDTPLAEIWDGDHWETSDTQLPGQDGSDLEAVSCPAPEQCNAVGEVINGPANNEAGSGESQQLAPAIGSYVSPVDGVPVKGQMASSTDNEFTSTYTSTGSDGLFDITVKKKNITAPVVSTQGQLGAFGPNNLSFVTESLTNSGQLDVQLFNLRNAPNDDQSPFTPVWSIDPTVTSAKVEFSPSGHYLMVGYTTASQTFFDIADTSAPSQQDEDAFTSGAITPDGPPGTCSADDSAKCGVVSYGWAPNDSRFTYDYIGTGAQQVQWRWVDLATPQDIYSFQTSGNSSFAQFSPGGTFLAIVDGTGSSAAGADLFATDGGADVGSTGTIQNAGPIDLHATTDEEIATINGVDHNLVGNSDLVWTVTAMTQPSVSAPAGTTGWTFNSADFTAISCVTTTDCIAVGEWAYTGVQSGLTVTEVGPALEHWDGSAWTDVFSPSSSPFDSNSTGVSCVGDGTTADTCIVVGGGANSPEVLRHVSGQPWTTWKSSTGPKHPNGASYSISGVSCVSAANCTAVGFYRPGGASGINATYAMTWDGTAWTVQPTPTYDEGSFLVPTAISCESAGVCAAVGEGPDAQEQNGQARLDPGAFILSEGQGWQTGLTATPSSANYGDSITYKATVKGPNGYDPTGEIQVDGIGSCNAQLVAGTASCTTTLTQPVDGSITAYLIYGSGQGSDSDLSGGLAAPIDVSPAPTTIQSVSAPASPVTVGTSVTYSATATSSDPALKPSGQMVFSVGSTALCATQFSAGSASCASNTAPIGTDTITATYTGTDLFAASAGTTSLTVNSSNAATATTTDISVSPADAAAEHSVTYSATVSGSGGTPSGSVDFTATGGAELCSAVLSGGAGHCQSNDAPPGTDTITGTYSGDSTYNTSSGTTTLAISTTGTTPRVFVSNGGNDTVTSYSATFSGNHPPASTIQSAASTGLNEPNGSALDSGGNLWVTDCASDGITEYAASALETTAATAPANTITDDGSGSLACPQDLAFDPAGDLWVTNHDNDSVVEFDTAQLAALTTTGDPTPTATLTDNPTGAVVGSSTQDTLIQPEGLAFDSSGDLWVASELGTVCEFVSAQLTTGSPAATTTRWTVFGGYPAFDAAGDLWVAETEDGTLAEYQPSQLANGDTSQPITEITGGNQSTLEDPTQIGFDAGGDLWVANSQSEDIDEYTPAQLNASADPIPHLRIRGIRTGLGDPSGIAVQNAADASGTIQLSSGSVTDGDQVTYSTTVTGAAGTPTGTVDFQVGGTDLCTATLASGVASCTSTNAPIGADAVAAVYSGDPTFAAANLTGASLQVAPPDSMTQLTIGPSSVPAGRNALFTVSVVGTQGSTPTAGEIVTVTAGVDTLCSTFIDASGSGECVGVAPMSTGAKQITASYPGDTINAASSDTEPLDVTAAAPIGADLVAGDSFGNQLDTFDPTATGDAVPVTTIDPDPSDALDGPNEFAVDADGDLWVANCGGTIAEYTADTLGQTGAPAPDNAISGTLDCPQGLAFDSAGDLWVSEASGNRLVEFSAAQVAAGGSPAPIAVIDNDAAGDLTNAGAIAIGPDGSLWVAAAYNNELLGYSAEQLASSGNPTPKTIHDGGHNDLASPNGLTFDGSGDLWVSDTYYSSLLEFTPSQLSAGDNPAAHVVIGDDGNSDLVNPGQIAFNPQGNAWVGTGNGTLLHYSTSQLAATGTPTPSDIVTPGLDSLEWPSALIVLPAPGTPPALSAPTGLTAIASATKVALSWHAPAHDGGNPVTSYDVLRSNAAGGTFSQIGTSSDTSYPDTMVSGGHTYYYEVEAVTSAATSAPSGAVSATVGTVATAPSAPRNLVAKAGKKSVKLTWSVPSSTGGATITGYRVRASTNGTAWTSGTTTTSHLSLTVTGLRATRKYYFDVLAVNSAGTSPASTAATATPYTTPGVPRSIKATAGKKSITVMWKAPASTGGAPITNYVVEYATCKIGTHGCTAHTKSVKATHLTLSRLKARSTYHLAVRAVNKGGAGTYSMPVSKKSRA